MNIRLKNHTLFFTFYTIVFLSISVILLIWNKEDIHIFLNQFHSPVMDVFFKYTTHLGDGLALAILAISFFFVNYRATIQIALAGIISGVIAQFLKKVIFDNIQRPFAHFQELGIDLFYVDGVEMHTAFSFPSGHGTSTFAMITSLVLIQKKPKFDFLLFVSAILIAYSRVYLSQHFLIDIYAGSLIGTSTAVLVHLYLYSDQKMSSQKLDKSLINLFTKSH